MRLLLLKPTSGGGHCWGRLSDGSYVVETRTDCVASPPPDGGRRGIVTSARGADYPSADAR
jgi:hypothetical protein